MYTSIIKDMKEHSAKGLFVAASALALGAAAGAGIMHQFNPNPTMHDVGGNLISSALGGDSNGEVTGQLIHRIEELESLLKLQKGFDFSKKSNDIEQLDQAYRIKYLDLEDSTSSTLSSEQKLKYYRDKITDLESQLESLTGGVRSKQDLKRNYDRLFAKSDRLETRLQSMEDQLQSSRDELQSVKNERDQYKSFVHAARLAMQIREGTNLGKQRKQFYELSRMMSNLPAASMLHSKRTRPSRLKEIDNGKEED